MKLPQIRVGLVIIQDGRLLLVQHRKMGRSYWLLPGGRLDFGETLEECARRELMEETNLEIKLKDFLFINESIPEDRHRHIVNLYFEAEVIGGNLKKGNEEILQEVRFFSLNEIEELILYPPIKEILKKIMRKERRFFGYTGNMWAK